MLAKGPVSRKRRASKTGVAGKGRYKTWSAEAILRTSFLVSNLIENLQSPTVHFFPIVWLRSTAALCNYPYTGE